MPINLLQIHTFRNILQAEISCSPHFNLFFGDNAAGKTTILEAIYVIGMGKSFRSLQFEHIIQRNAEKLVLFLQFEADNTTIPIGIERARDGSYQFRMNETSVRSIAALSQQLPIQWISSASHRILTDGPKVRRQFLDWGLFYTNPAFYSLWRQFQRLLSHRNAALKARAPKEELLTWNQQLVEVAEALDTLRQSYIADFLPFFNQIIAILIQETPISLHYSRGWTQNESLLSLLERNIYREYQLGHTLYGPHRADLSITSQELPAQEVLSQGQQKLVSYALRLAQGLQLQALTGKAPIYLIDDLPSELDPQKRKLVAEILSNLQAQVFITGIEHADLAEIQAFHPKSHMFHVKHGQISPYVPGECFT